jgi:hypothetical protein
LINFSPLVNQPVVLLVQLNVREMEEGKIATAGHSLVRLKEVHQCIRMRVQPGVQAGWDQFQPLVNQPVVLLVQLNVREMEEGKIATAWAQFGD